MGKLFDLIKSKTLEAKALNALVSFETKYKIINEGGIDFVVRIATNLQRKPTGDSSLSSSSGAKEDDSAPKKKNPFLPPFEDGLFVSELGSSHSLLFNKFNVVDHHTLVVTRDFAPQTHSLTAEDFEAIQMVMNDMDALAFYNCGPLSGASQPHRHVQLVPRSLIPSTTRDVEEGSCSLLPVDPHISKEMNLLGGKQAIKSHFRIPCFPFKHAVYPLCEGESPKALLSKYEVLKSTLGMTHDSSFNLLMTKDWILLVPRTKERCGNVSINAVGFCGSMFVKSEQDLAFVEDTGPLSILKEVTFSNL